MDADDEFGDLYTDILATTSSAAAATATTSLFPSSSFKPSPNSPPNFDFENDEDILYSATGSNFCHAVPETLVPDSDLVPDSILGHKPVAELDSGKKDADWDDDVKRGQDSQQEEVGVPKVLVVAKTEPLQTLEPIENGKIGEDNGRNGETGGFDPKGLVEVKKSLDVEIDVLNSEAIPGISDGSFVPRSFENGGGGLEIGMAKSSAKDESGDDWDSDSEDDLQIVLNNNCDSLGAGPHIILERNVEVGSDDEDEDGEDLVIVTGGDPHQPIEEQEWGDDSAQPPLDGERKEMAEVGKVNGGLASLPRIGYSNHGYHHHSQFKYVRPGAAALPGSAINSTGGTPGQVRALAPMVPLAGRGRGDWRAPMQKGFHSGFGLPVWGNNSAMRAFGSGLEFTLPPHKTVFDIDIDTFEEKPWRHPGVDTSDFFNFGLDEDNWKDYCKHLEQLRLEATMQSKIRVYESGRSEQDYDPDLPPELAAAAGIHDASAENPHLGKPDVGQADLVGHGRGASHIRPQIPMGRAIQVEGGYGERLPSVDTRPPRFRDSDSVIEIALQDSVDDDSMACADALEQQETVNQGEDLKDRGHVAEEGDKQLNAEYFEHFPQPYNGRTQEIVSRRAPFLGPVPGNVHEGDGILPFPSEAPLQYHPNSKARAAMYPGRPFGAPHGGRWPQGTGRERYPQLGGEPANDVVPNQSARANRFECQLNEKSGDSLEGKPTSETSCPVTDEAGKEQSIEHKTDLNEHVLADGVEVEGEEVVSDLRLPSEAPGDSSSNHSSKKQKLSSRIEPAPATGDLGDDLRTQSDSSKARSGSSRDYQKRHDGGEEEVVQGGQSRRIGDGRRRHEEEESSFRRKDEYARDGRQEIERTRTATKGREDLYHGYPHRDWDANSAHHARIKGDTFERPKARDGSLGVRQRREEDSHSRREKDDDSRRRERVEDTGSKHRSKANEIDRNERDENLHARRKVEDGDWRGRHDKDRSRHRERDDRLMGRHESFEDTHSKRRKEEDLQRRERVEKEEALHNYRGREDGGRRKRERDDEIELRREDQARVRDKPDDHHSLRHRDVSWQQREREDRQRLKPSHGDAQSNRDREEGRDLVRSRRVLEEKSWHGNSRAKDDPKGLGSDREHQTKDKRRHGEQAKIRDRVDEEAILEHSGREDLYARENQSANEERNPRRERSSVQNEIQQMYKERHKENARSKESEGGDQSVPAPGKRKQEYSASHRSEKFSTKGMAEQETGNLLKSEHIDSRDNIQSRSTYSSAASKKTHHHHHSQREGLGLHHSTNKHGGDVLLEDDQQQSLRRGRSKLERWASQKEGDTSSSTMLSSKLGKESERNDSGRTNSAMEPKEPAKKGGLQLMDGDENADDLEPKDDDMAHGSDTRLTDSDRNGDGRHLDTVLKLKKRSERFKIPMLSEEMLVNKESGVFCAPQSEAVADAEVKHERPARKRRWVSN